jgi:hypothetical protein
MRFTYFSLIGCWNLSLQRASQSQPAVPTHTAGNCAMDAGLQRKKAYGICRTTWRRGSDINASAG